MNISPSLSESRFSSKYFTSAEHAVATVVKKEKTEKKAVCPQRDGCLSCCLYIIIIINNDDNNNDDVERYVYSTK